MADRAIILADLRNGGNPNPRADASVCDGAVPGRRIQAVAVGAPIDPGAVGLWIGFGDITNRALIEAAARSGLTVFLDTSGATLKEVTRAAGWHQLAFRGGDVRRVAHRLALRDGAALCLVHGVIGDAPPNLRAIQRMAEVAMVPVGFIDTSDGRAGPLALAAGAEVLVRGSIGLDGWIDGIRRAEAILGAPRKLPDASEAAVVAASRRRLVAVRDLQAGHMLNASDLRADAPGPRDGEFAPYQDDSVVGRTLQRPLSAGDPLRGDMLDGAPPSEAAWFVPRPPSQRPD